MRMLQPPHLDQLGHGEREVGVAEVQAAAHAQPLLAGHVVTDGRLAAGAQNKHTMVKRLFSLVHCRRGHAKRCLAAIRLYPMPAKAAGMATAAAVAAAAAVTAAATAGESKRAL